jgi:hypothetical protein
MSDRVKEELDRDLAIEPGVAGAVGLSHPADAERGPDFVYADAADGGLRQSGHSMLSWIAGYVAQG